MGRKGREPCPSKNHFAKVVTNVEGRPAKITWKCDHCGKHVMSGLFRAATARVHLAAVKRNGICSNLCDATDDHAKSRQAQFVALIKDKRKERNDKERKRKYQDMRLQQQEDDEVQILAKKKGKTKMTQPKLKDFIKPNDAAAADLATSKWALAHNIPPNAMQGPYWKRMIKKLGCVTPVYKPMYPSKIWNDMLPILREQAEGDTNRHLRHRPDVGRTVTGDGATKQKVPLINFLVHVPTKGVKLLNIHDCTEHLRAGGVKDAM